MHQNRPTLLLTRPEPAARRFADQVRARLGDVPIVIAPVLRIVPRPVAVDLEGAAAVILTSAHAVPWVESAGLPAFCVGERTAAAARAAGLDAVSGGGAADDLVALVLERAPAGRLVFPHGAETRGQVAERLTAQGYEVDSVVVYAQEPQPLAAEARALLSGTADIVMPLFSPRSAALLAAACRHATAPLRLVAISETARAAWDGPAPMEQIVARTPDAGGVLDALARLYRTMA